MRSVYFSRILILSLATRVGWGPYLSGPSLSESLLNARQQPLHTFGIESIPQNPSLGSKFCAEPKFEVKNTRVRPPGATMWKENTHPGLTITDRTRIDRPMSFLLLTMPLVRAQRRPPVERRPRSSIKKGCIQSLPGRGLLSTGHWIQQI